MHINGLRIALFSGNYNYVRDGANKALNKLVGYLLAQGAEVRVYSATSPTPAFPPVGTLVSVRSIAFPFGRGEYRLAFGLPAETRADLEAFQPDIVHVAAPDWLGHRAVSWARKRKLPILASIHTRFETYLSYYRLGLFEPLLKAIIHRFNRRADMVVVPSLSLAKEMEQAGAHDRIGLWTRGVESSLFNPANRSDDFRLSLGISPNEVVIGFLGRLVLEKGLDVFVDSIEALKAREIPHRILVIGDGPARGWFNARLPEARFVGFQQGLELGKHIAAMDIFFNPSVTEAFGNVTLEALAAGIPAVAADAPGSRDIVLDGITGRLIAPGAIQGFAAALQAYCVDEALRTKHGKAGFEHSKSYEWDRVNQAIIDCYLQLCSEKKSSRG